MKKLIIIISILLISCSPNLKREKPFIIVCKDHLCKNIFRYGYQDNTNRIYYFSSYDIYNIGDTIK